ncbi:Hypothetical predicted protein [Cloeon dipterum]|uniref:Uncharacterized protein n=1 Tax=Cloeon dipterum TaxID=197152 RepID=A0A8S1D7J0_9INSE|nr:Hypothetical predicted protein [Cloeon dipterum]
MLQKNQEGSAGAPVGPGPNSGVGPVGARGRHDTGRRFPSGAGRLPSRGGQGNRQVASNVSSSECCAATSGVQAQFQVLWLPVHTDAFRRTLQSFIVDR